jgi:hypothetical protein
MFVFDDPNGKRPPDSSHQDQPGGAIARGPAGSLPRRTFRDVVQAAARQSVPDHATYAYLLGCCLRDGLRALLLQPTLGGHQADILGALRVARVRVTQPNHRNLAVSHRDSVAIMERIVGPKA